MSHLIVVSIGPVQGYISQSRRTQDLWQSSRILSYLTGMGIQQVASDWVIYPRIDENKADENTAANIPNRFIIRHPDDQKEAVETAKQIEAAIRNAWFDEENLTGIAGHTWQYFKCFVANPSEALFKMWSRQVSNWLECYWVVVEETGSYQADIKRANAAMSARKMVRNFDGSAENGFKCTITGEHEALHNGDGSYANVRDFWANIKEAQRNKSLISTSDRLSALSVVKRMAHEPEKNLGELKIEARFPSTSSIAAAPFRYAVLQNWGDLHEDVDNYLKTLKTMIPADQLYFHKNGKPNPEYFRKIELEIDRSILDDRKAINFRSIDGDFLFEDTLIANTIEEYGGSASDEQLSDARKALDKLVTKALQPRQQNGKEIIHPPPHPYLAILSMDGDKMGQHVSTLGDVGRHRSFSSNLAQFARNEVTKIVEEQHLGRLVYAGGDDVLALLPVQDALEVANQLRQDFNDYMADQGFHDLHMSAGIAFVHHTHNLQDAIQAAHKAQEDAKENYGRCAIAVRLLRRSGEHREMGMKWQLKGQSTIEQIIELVNYFTNDQLAHNLPFELEHLVYSMTSDQAIEDGMDAARAAELRRIVKRRRTANESVVERVIKICTQLTQPIDPEDMDCTPVDEKEPACDPVIRPERSIAERWGNLIHWVELARFVAQAKPRLENVEG
ncbi:MAG: type III-B CRISPR-associated protein Cas10/Cmr2 [Chloroflexi bacterium]|nr:MAG: type III-B CRISPR-associated protein Cas10/Cmr2 [Chloroflexota bacterium]